MSPDLRAALLALGLLFCLVFGMLTLGSIEQRGFDFLTAISFVIIAMVILGLIGAMRNPPGG
jgi:hypothetical protein